MCKAMCVCMAGQRLHVLEVREPIGVQSLLPEVGTELTHVFASTLKKHDTIDCFNLRLGFKIRWQPWGAHCGVKFDRSWLNRNMLCVVHFKFKFLGLSMPSIQFRWQKRMSLSWQQLGQHHWWRQWLVWLSIWKVVSYWLGQKEVQALV